MGWTDWIVSLGLIALVVRQLRGRRLTAAGLLWPVGLVVWAAVEYLHGVPDRPSDLTLTTGLAVVGLALGSGCAVLTRLRVEGDQVVARATRTAAALWILGMSGRLAFGIFATHGGGPAVARLSDQLHLQSPHTWATALIAAALGEVLARTAILTLRLGRTRAAVRPSAT